MKEGPVDDDAGQHPDEGTIHAWLDDALGAPEAAAIDAHVRGCAACAERVAEARGLIAGASRVVRELDDVPAGVLPTWGQSRPAAVPPSVGATPTAGDGSLWRMLRVTPARAAIAASLLVVAGITLTRDRGGLDAPTVASMTADSGAPAADAAAASTRPRDALLDSAVARNLEQAQPSMAIGAAPGQAIPQAPVAPPSPTAMADGAAGMGVAAGRAAAAVQRETAGVSADRLRVKGTAVASAPADVMTAAPQAGGATGSVANATKATDLAQTEAVALSRIDGRVGGVAQSRREAVAISCLNVSSTTSSASVAGIALPFLVSLPAGDSDGGRSRPARIYRGGVLQADVSAVIREARDTLRLELERAGARGEVVLGPRVGGLSARGGVARPATVGVAEQVYSSAPARPGTAERRAASAPAAAAPVPPTATRSVAPLAVSAQPASCPTP
jgi:hypothetical protein